MRQCVPIIKTSYYSFITSIYRPNIIINKSVFFILLSWFIIFIMKKLSIDVTEKQYYLLSRIAKSDDRRLQDLLYLIFSLGLSIYFCERSVYISKDDNEFTEEEKKQNALKQINIDNQKIKDEIIKEDTTYCLVNGTNEKSIVNGDSFKDSEVENNA